MDSIVIRGGNRLNGQIQVSGAKNSAIKLMAASILTDQPLLLTNMPRLADTRFLGQLLQQFGVDRPEYWDQRTVFTGTWKVVGLMFTLLLLICSCTSPVAGQTFV